MRVKGGPVTRRRRKKWLKAAEGSWGTRHTSYRIAKQTVIRASQYAYNDRRKRKSNFRKLWIARINAAVREMGYTYSDFMHKLKVNKIEINRKLLSELAINNPVQFEELVNKVMK
ncbi:MAG: 50S ribosomal protein L20 [Mycoplasma sp.]